MNAVFSARLAAIVDEVTLKFGDNIDAAVDELMVRAKKLPDFDSFVNDFLRQAFRERVHWCRHEYDRKARRANGTYSKPAKVVAINSEEGAKAAEKMSLYNYYISGVQLGDVTGLMLGEIKRGECEKSKTASFHVRLIEELQPLVPANKKVRDSVSESKLNKIFDKARAESGLTQDLTQDTA